MAKKKALIGVGAVVVLIGMAYALLVRALAAGTSELIGTVPSPGGSHVAYMQAHTKDVTGLVRYSLTVLPADEPFRLDQDVVYDAWYPFELEWPTDTSLFVKNGASIDQVQGRRAGDVRIVYTALKNPDSPGYLASRIQEVVPSPDGEYLAYRYETPGVYDNAVYHVLSLRKAGETFQYDYNDDLFVSTNIPFTVDWTGDRALHVANSPEGEVLLQLLSYDEVRVSYEYRAEFLP